MDFAKMISSRLKSEKFYENSYYKFEKYSNLKKEHIKKFGNNIIDFGIGEGDDMPPINSLNTISKQIYNYENRVYSDNGIDEFKIACATYLNKYFNILIDDPINQINHCIGAKSALTILPLIFISKDDIVISTTPGYEVLANMASYLDAQIYKVELLKENNYLPDLDCIDENIYKKCKIFIINYPNNPTGAIATRKFYDKLINLAIKYNFIIVNDNTYGYFTYKQKPLSIFANKKAYSCAIEIHSFSKCYNMTGMRIGFVVANNQMIDIFKKMKDNIDSGQYIPIQLGVIQAIIKEDNYLKRLKEKYYTRMKKVSKIFNKNGISTNISKGAFYLYVKVPAIFNSAEDFSIFLLKKCGIFTIPFDEVSPSIRLSMTFKINDSESSFYKDLDYRLKNICMNKSNIK